MCLSMSRAWEQELQKPFRDPVEQGNTFRRSVSIGYASMSQALRKSDRLFSHGGKDRSIADLAAELFEGADLVLELLWEGLIDENFTLYITQFPGQAISASAMNFIIKAVQPNVMDREYHFGTGEEPDINDIKAVLEAETRRLLDGQSIYNIEIFDYLLAEDPNKLDEPIRRLVASAASDSSFIDDYLISGRAAPALVQRLSSVWEGIFDYLIGEGSEVPDYDLLDAAMRGVRSELMYATNAAQRSALATAIPNLPTATEPQRPERAVSIAETILQMDICVDDLSAIAEPLRTELSKRNVYPITLANLVAIIGDQTKISLDSLKEAQESDVYAHVLTHLRDYLGALTQATTVPTVADPDNFSDILSDVAETDVDAVEEVARGAGTDCMLGDLDQVQAPFWPAIANAHRFALTARNVASYIGQHGVDSGLANWLRTSWCHHGGHRCPDSAWTTGTESSERHRAS